MLKKIYLVTTIIGTVLSSAALADAIWNAPVIDGSNIYKEIFAPTTVPDNQKGLNENPLWQMLGNSWGANDGVMWSINGGDFTNSVTDFYVGDEIRFEFNMYKTLWGTHSYDAIKVWIDGTSTSLFEYDTASGTIGGASNIWDFNKAPIPSEKGIFIDEVSYYHNYNSLDYDDQGSSKTNKLAYWNRYYADTSKFFVSNAIKLTEEGTFDLIARVTCSDDLGGSDVGHYPDRPDNADWANWTTNNKYWQGETEKYIFNVTTRDVPEPSILSLLGLGLFSFTFFRRKKTK